MGQILVIGGAKAGIGQATTAEFLRAGHQVVASYGPEDVEAVGSLANEHRDVTYFELDDSDPIACQAALSSLTFDFTAAVVADFFFYMEDRAEFDPDKWNHSLFSNITMPKLIGHYAINTWTNCRTVVFVTSSEANTGSFGAPAYAASKAATHNLARSLANVAAGQCRFNCVAAGWIGGVMDTDEVFNRSRAVTPLGRLGTPEEVANVVRWMSSEDSSFVNGATLFVDGGYTGVDTVSKYEFETEFGSLLTADN